jgi:hypothetical protein
MNGARLRHGKPQEDHMSARKASRRRALETSQTQPLHANDARDMNPWGPQEHAGTGSAGLAPRPGDDVIGGGTSGGEESPADARDAEQAERESRG